MTLITFQDGAVVFRDGQVGTEQACCCGGCPATVGAGATASVGPGDEAAADAALQDFVDYLTDQGFFQALTDAGYTNLRTEYEVILDTGDSFEKNLTIYAECCGEVDEEDTPAWDDFDLQPGEIPDLASAFASPIYPCNPLP